ncbi:MAG: isocitrate lyase/phosphoenolpyruvate mutase family protein [Rhizobiales bacterium]|nr:isocitrate lyase/phosphoenolpyruvate mutase family protein [Hyphomicrobiales bacterium]
MKQLEKAQAFKRLHEQPGTFVIPNPWDAGSAKFLEHLGFKALATTSAGLAFALGRPDGERMVSREETMTNAATIVDATSLPVSADLESGFGDEPEMCAETIRLAGLAGLVGGSIEDATGRDGGPIYEVKAAAARVEAAAEAARSLGYPFMLTGRAENYLHGRADLADTIARLQAYQAAGADVLYAPGLGNLDDIATLVRNVDRPVNVLMGLSGVRLSVDDLARVGVKRISVGGAFARAAYGGFLKAAREVREKGTFEFNDAAMPYAELQGLFSTENKRRD